MNYMDETRINPIIPPQENVPSPTKIAPIAIENKYLKLPAVGLIIFIIILLGTIGYLVYQNYQLKMQQTIINKNVTPAPITAQPNNNNSGEVDYYFIPKPFVSFQSPAGWVIGNNGVEELVLKKGANYCVSPYIYECPGCKMCNTGEKPDNAHVAVYKTS